MWSFIHRQLVSSADDREKAVDLNPITSVCAPMRRHVGRSVGLVFAVPVAGLLKEAGHVFTSGIERKRRGLVVASQEFAVAAAEPCTLPHYTHTPSVRTQNLLNFRRCSIMSCCGV
ncbi:MAG: hypothetical protein IPN19_09610 [Elusimicrobia bacterium]|nr:hypothetical protein [Elusimicrobiota bacterium]